MGRRIHARWKAGVDGAHTDGQLSVHPQQLGTNLYLMTDYDPPAEGRILEFTRQGQVRGSTTHYPVMPR